MAKRKAGWFEKIIVGAVITAFFSVLGVKGYEWWMLRKSRFVQYSEFGISIPVNYAIHGIDVSRYQQYIDWPSVKAMEVENVRFGFAFIKATEGLANTDPFFKRNWKQARDAGVHRGAYHFFLSTKSGKLQAQQFIKNVKLDSGDLPPVLDIESAYGVSAASVQQRVREWLATVEEYYKVKPIIYTSIGFYERYLDTICAGYPLWIAHYLQPHKPRIQRDWTFWQHSENGRVNGIINKVDFNVFNGDSTEFRTLLVN